jgi:hypothetical protein
VLVEVAARQFDGMPAEKRLVTAGTARAVGEALGRDSDNSIALRADDFS